MVKYAVIVTMMSVLLFGSCSSIRSGMYLISIDDNSGSIILQDEPKVRAYLESIITKYKDYSMQVFARTPVNFPFFKRSRLLTHNFFLIFCNEKYNTLSYYGTDMLFYSEGTWVLDSDADTESYEMYLKGDNLWDVEKMFSDKTIDVKKTAENIISKIDSNVTYYYADHVNDKSGVDNCNTALYESLAFYEQ
jgi:hypothetical protein